VQGGSFWTRQIIEARRICFSVPFFLAIMASRRSASLMRPKRMIRLLSRTIRTLAVALVVVLCADAQAQSHKVTERRNVDYVPQADYRDGKDRLDLYIPDGLTDAPVILSLHGGVLMMGDRREESTRFLAART
jgi:acetyl esterase/lipase